MRYFCLPISQTMVKPQTRRALASNFQISICATFMVQAASFDSLFARRKIYVATGRQQYLRTNRSRTVTAQASPSRSNRSTKAFFFVLPLRQFHSHQASSGLVGLGRRFPRASHANSYVCTIHLFKQNLSPFNFHFRGCSPTVSAILSSR